MKRILPRRRRKASSLFMGKAAIVALSGSVMALIVVFADKPKGMNDFDREPDGSRGLPADRLLDCTLRRIVDGDSIAAWCDGYDVHIRLMGIDAPEIGQEPWGEQSKRQLATLLPDAFLLNTHGEDVYHRTLGTVYADGHDINALMIEAGWAVAYDGKQTPLHYREAEKYAKTAKLGVWSRAGDQQDPRRWRRYHQ